MGEAVHPGRPEPGAVHNIAIIIKKYLRFSRK